MNDKIDPVSSGIVPADFEDRRRHAWQKLGDCIPEANRKGRLLDIACGTGNGVVAALQRGFELAVGIDRSFGEFVWFRVDDFDRICSAYGVNPSHGLLVEGDLFQVAFPARSFDCVMMLDSIEHVPDPKRFIEVAAGYVASGGYLIIDTAPLFYCKVGHHLWTYFPMEKWPWAHLRRDFPRLVEDAKIDTWSMDRFNELNKVTHAEVKRFVEETGLTIELEHRDAPDEESRATLESLKSELVLDRIPFECLFESWVLLVAKRP